MHGCNSVYLIMGFIFVFSVSAELKISQEERVALDKFRESVQHELYRDYMKSEWYLLRWLKARNFDQASARTMLLQALKWRKDEKIDGILDEKYYEPTNAPFFCDGRDREGSVVVTLFASRVDVRQYIVSGRRIALIRGFIQILETAEQEIYKQTGIIGNVTLEGNATHLANALFDMHGYSLRSHSCLACFSVYVEWFDLFETKYPGYLKHYIYINAPRIFTPLLQSLKPLMSKQTWQALKVYGSNIADWKPAINKIVAPDQIRVPFGGTKPF